ncbi:MAG: polyprenol monophosphomannose synthase [Phycisphaerae bacterium]|nr:polyprenol monophosphomannose synthase [Phycisphaerae bacterium]
MPGDAGGQTDLISVAVPTYREAENIPLLVPRVHDALRSADLAHEIILIDDDSADGSLDVVDRLARDGLPVRMIVRQGERGLSTAVIRGFDESRGRYLVCMDADLSHPPESIPTMIELLRAGQADFVLGSRFCPGGGTDAQWGLFRWLNSHVAKLLARPLSRLDDPMSGFFALERQTYLRVHDLNPIGYKIALELIVKCGCRDIREVPIHFADRKLGQSKLNATEQLNYLRHLYRLYRYLFSKR